MRPEGRASPGAEAGFTLLETLVALAVLGVVLATLFRLAGDTLVQHQSRESQLRLALTAEAALHAARLGGAGLESGSWPLDLTVSVERQDLAAAAAGGLEMPAAAVGDTLDWLTVTVVDADGRSFALSGIVGRQRR